MGFWNFRNVAPSTPQQLKNRGWVIMFCNTVNRASTMESFASGNLNAHAIRLNSGSELGPSLEAAALKAMEASDCSSAFVLSAVGSVDFIRLRMANANRSNEEANDIKEWRKRFEIVSLVGTFSNSGKHLHMSLSDAEGNVVGGHLVSGRVFTTVELVIGTIKNVSFDREFDALTGYRELAVKQIVPNQSVRKETELE